MKAKDIRNVAVVARTGRLGEIIADELHAAGFVIVKKNPDLTFCIGGEGATLWGEIYTPGAPRLSILHREDNISAAQRKKLKKILKAVKQGSYKVVEFPKLRATARNGTLTALNDINIHYQPPYAIGLEVRADRTKKKFLGDGLVVATPYGSGAYFRSITRRTFSRGIGVAFNNPTVPMAPLFLSKSARLEVRVWKHRGVIAADANPHVLGIKAGDVIKISVAREVARAIQINGLPLKIKL